MEDPIACCNKCGVTPPVSLFSDKPQVQESLASPLPSPSHAGGGSEEVECNICTCVFLLAEEPVHMTCMHQFCRQCWERSVVLRPHFFFQSSELKKNNDAIEHHLKLHGIPFSLTKLSSVSVVYASSSNFLVCHTLNYSYRCHCFIFFIIFFLSFFSFVLFFFLLTSFLK
jgi:hypothetical protein